MSHQGQTFFTYLGCMDGRTKDAAVDFGRKKFSVMYADTITEAGIDKLLANIGEGSEIYNSIKNKIEISLDKHGSLGIIIEGHQDCAGNPVEKDKHLNDIKLSVEKVKSMFSNRELKIIGIFIYLFPQASVEEV